MYKRILVPLDGSEAGEAGLQRAIVLARAGEAKLLLLHVLVGSHAAADGETEKARHRQALRLLAQGKEAALAAGLHCETLLREFTGRGVSSEIEKQATLHHCDLVVMGTHGRRGLERLALGSVAHEVARTTRVPLLLVPPPA